MTIQYLHTTVLAMDYDYRKRGYLLPHGCKDLIDAINLTGDPISPSDIIKQDDGLMVIFRLPGLQSDNIEIFVEGNRIRVVCKSSQSSRESILEAPPGYELAKARATYIEDSLQIFIPKC